MFYAKVKDGAVIEYPVFEQHIKNRGHLTSDYVKVAGAAKPPINTVTEVLVERKPEFVDGVLTQVFNIDLKPLDLMRRDMIAALSDYRYQREVGGITIGDGVKIDTDRGSQAAIMSVYSSLSSGLINEAQWKSGGEWVSVNTDEMKSIAEAVASHVQRCFRAESSVSKVINGKLKDTTLSKVDYIEEFEKAYKA